MGGTKRRTGAFQGEWARHGTNERGIGARGTGVYVLGFHPGRTVRETVPPLAKPAEALIANLSSLTEPSPLTVI
jgi:hypothetical protein